MAGPGRTCRTWPDLPDLAGPAGPGRTCRTCRTWPDLPDLPDLAAPNSNICIVFIFVFSILILDLHLVIGDLLPGNAGHTSVLAKLLQNSQNCRLGSGRREPDSRKHWPHRCFQKWCSGNALRENPMHTGVCVEHLHLTYLYLYFRFLIRLATTPNAAIHRSPFSQIHRSPFSQILGPGELFRECCTRPVEARR